VLNRQKYLKELGFYTGALDGTEGAKTREAYKKLQDRYFKRALDRTGKYDTNTDILLQNAWRVKKNCKNFKLEEFRCSCGMCTGYPVVLDTYLLANLQSVRNMFGACTITSGLRCKKHNDSLKGSAKNSRHLSGKAVDIVCGVSKTEAGRQKVMNYWRTLKNQRYCYCNIAGSHKHMGNAVHLDTK
jgi:hypothetical protein